MNFPGNVFFLSVAISLLLPFSAFPGEKFSFSGHVRRNVGCTEMVTAPVKNATVEIHDNHSCIIDALPKRKVSPSYKYRTITDSSGFYRFENLDADSFSCYPINQMVDVEAPGYQRQARDILPGRDSNLDFDLLVASVDSIVSVTVSVVAVDTSAFCRNSGSCPALPLKNYYIEIPDRYLFWRLPLVKDTTDNFGTATFPLSVTPFVDYRITARAVDGSSYQSEVVADIATCMGNEVTIKIHIPRTSVTWSCPRPDGSFTVERVYRRSNSEVVVDVGGAAPEALPCNLELYDFNGKLVSSTRRGTKGESTGKSRSLTLNTGNLSGGMYLLKIRTGDRVLSERILLGR